MKLPVGVYEKALPTDLSWPERFEVAAEAGFNFIELSIDESEARLARLTPHSAERKAIAKALQTSAVPLKSLCLSGHRKYALGSASKAVRDKGLEIFAQAIDLAGELGIRIIQVAGYYVYYEPETPDSLHYYTEGLAKGLQMASQAGVMLAIENMDTRGVISLSQGLKIIKQFNSPWLQLYPDIGNLSERQQDTLAELTRANHHMVALHIKDARPGEPRRVPFGEGDVPFDAAFTTLAELGFCGPVLIEMWNDNTPNALKRVINAKAWVLAKMQKSGLYSNASAV